jgi:hypothetical protein
MHQSKKNQIQTMKAHDCKTGHEKEIRKARRKNCRPPRGHAANLRDVGGESKDGAHPLGASGARRIGEVSYENIVRPSTFKRTPQKRNGYYSKQKISSMRDCKFPKKKFTARLENKFRQKKIKMQEAACAQKKL